MTCAPNQGCSGTGIRDSSSECGSVRRVYCGCEAGVVLRAKDAESNLLSARQAIVEHCRFCALDGGR